MGCTSTAVVESRRAMALPPEAINSYIDRFPAIILHKIKQKFEQFADKERKRLNIFHFIQLHSVTGRNSDMLKRLFQYYTDYEGEEIALRQFIIKYATLIKSEPHVLSSILFEIHKDSIDSALMSRQEFNNFYENETFFFGKQPKPAEFPISLQQFGEILKESHFNYEDFQDKLTITTQEDIPFKMITREILDCDFNDLSIGKEYYILSNAWFYRWSFYYQQLDAKATKERIKSTKLLANDEGSVVGRRYKKKEASMNQRRMLESLKTSQLNSNLLEQPRLIDFQDIQGQYRGELKENLKIASQVKIITDGLWRLLCKLHPPEQEFKRVAISQDKLEYYPKAIYYFQTDDHGELKPNSQAITFVSVTQKVSHFKTNKSSSKLGIFSKNFGQKNWRELDHRLSFAQVSLAARFFVIVASNRQKFIQKFYRKQIKKDSLQPGDLIYAHFPYIKSHSQAYIIKMGSPDTLTIHFKGYSFRYEVQIRTQDASIVQSQAALSSAKKKHESLIKGIANVGNTCFMNAVIECLLATPILDIFLSEYKFNEKKQPIGYGLSEMARALLRNEKADAKKFKRLIDANMSIFSGFEQHDAQQFLNLLLDRLSEEIPQKPTVIDYLFGGRVQSKLTCNSCKNTKLINQKMYILSLPIPEPEFNYFNIVIVPVTSKTLKKMIFKLHKNATVSEYCSAFEERSGYNRKDFVFVETNQNSLKKIKEEILRSSDQKKKITDIGIVPNVSLLAFEKIPYKFYSDIAMRKSESNYKQLQPKPQAPWTICKILSSRSEKLQFVIEYVNPESTIEKVRIDKDLFAGRSAKIGSMTQFNFKKIILRKYNSSLRKLEQFGLQLLVGVPLWASYEDLMKITQRYIQNLKEKQAKSYRQKKGGDYIIRFLYQYRCVFCQKDIPVFNLDETQIAYCCEVLQKDIPLYWSSRSFNFSIFVDWIDFSKCNSMFCSYIQVDLISRNVQKSRQDEFVSLQSCIKLHNQTQSVEMECDTCRNKVQSLEHFIDKVPNILIIHMKEFRYTPEGHLIKIDLRLRWQQILDSSKYSIDANGKLYQLFAVVKHSGNSESGHYTCLAKRKHPFENKKVWVLFDDDITEITKQEQSFIDDAYLLCYKKVDMPTSGSVMYADIDRY